jgi:replicative DNA helicase
MRTTDQILPPHSLEAERCYIGCLLLAPLETLDSRPADPEVFYDLRHRFIYSEISEMAKAGKPVDLITVSQTLRDLGQLETAGGVAYLSSCMDEVPSAANLPYYYDILLDKMVLRKKEAYHKEEIENIRSFSGEISEYLVQSKAKLDSIIESGRVGNDGTMTGKEGANGFIDYAEKMVKNAGAYTGIPTGWRIYDKLTWGLQPGEMNIFGARPATGKTSVLCNVANHVALDLKVPVLIFSYEMTADRIVRRMSCQRARVNSQHLREGVVDERDIHRLGQAASEIANARLFIHDHSGTTTAQMRSIVRDHVRKHGVKLVMVDYLQRVPCQRRDKRNEEVAGVSTDLANMFKDFKVSSLVLAQLNRDSVGQAPKESDLGQSGQIETDADTITLLYKDPEATFVQDKWRYHFLMPKNRDGNCGVAHMLFDRQFTNFETSDDQFWFK